MNKQIRNDHGGLKEAKEVFRDELQEDKDFIEYKKKNTEYRSVNVTYTDDSSKPFMKIVKEFLELQEQKGAKK